MTAFDSFPLGQPGFVSHILDRAAHLRSNDEKLLALEGHRDARAYVVYRDSLVVKKEAGAPRALSKTSPTATSSISQPSATRCRNCTSM